MSNGLFDTFGDTLGDSFCDSFSRVRCIVMPAVALSGVRERGAGSDSPPDLTNDATAFSRFPPFSLRIARFRLSSVKPI